ncbi:MAG TPA: VOC family protein [Acidimicrobiales bacterium]|nr:VOC family protein [Acidimicrobiales bacterium]
MSRQVQVTFDTSDPHRLAAWWADLLGYAVEDGHDLVSGLLESGVITDADVMDLNGRLFSKDAVAASVPDDNGPRLYFQRVPEPKVVKNRVHLEIPVSQEELDDEVQSVTRAGASFVEFRSHRGHRWPVMRDPEGNEFCLH